ncbi:MAG: hypothetical protein MJA29_11105 [Candidatus Omnitrophica bacterium]|nr:hypothetical protein [Candidatus Omnitrophota bacterium]
MAPDRRELRPGACPNVPRDARAFRGTELAAIRRAGVAAIAPKLLDCDSRDARDPCSERRPAAVRREWVRPRRPAPPP